MKIIINPNDYTFADKTNRVVIALGTFDGVHLGHQKLLHKLVYIKQKYNYASMVYTFMNHPLHIMNDENKPSLLMTKQEKALSLQEYNIDYLYMVSFTKKFSMTPYDDFLIDLINKIPISHIVVGYDFKFGYNGMGTVQSIVKIASLYNVKVHVIPPMRMNDDVISSTKVRQYIANGNIQDANILLGKLYTLSGKVIQGKKIGRTLGFPTANIQYDPVKILPSNGVYVTIVDINGTYYPSITSVGTNPTVNINKMITIETHILNFNFSIYDIFIKVLFLKKLREEIRFTSRKDLVAQVFLDIAYANDFYKCR
jgi:riboflavin kinase / FMN adenylyltransferase